MCRQYKLLLFLLFFCIFVTACSNDRSILHKERSYTVQEKEIEIAEITVSAIGDMLIHRRVYNDAKIDSGYDFMPMLQHVEKYLNDTTITFANQETMIGGEELGLSTYPTFNSPKEVGDALKEVGVNVVSLANNHTLDRGEEVIQSAIRHWETIDMMYVGAYKDEADKSDIRVFQTDEGISVAFLAYTYGTNGIPVPENKDFLVNLIDKELMAAEIKEAKEKADVIILSLHFGNEYERYPSEEQKDLVQFAADQGVHAVLGHHPHVLQPMEWIEGKEGNQTFVVYSLGNFLSGQDKLYRQIGGIAKFTIRKISVVGKDNIEIVEPKFLPTYVSIENNSNYRVLPMFELTDHILPNSESHYEEIKNHMSQWMPELQFIEE